ncbi:hypothetical protein COCMIDRAFT_108724 [Bipolaris oryzae ATCC 44560]|uniref:Uncharacterized protein n=1 Tax=Bipolaris oryzae ATCC 44560 TaxID=930090 RepID=W6YS81_COCMI|nr:uncharacterized protein COCMIDRAFT_108724 [Bipolaris oryzae ATCC 44560]EUC40480.1 hypothetical protein COCMIDRAFT_108724 [Bipolaris oryzae ATCC 44560]
MRGNRSRRGNGREGIVQNVPRPSPAILQITDASIPASVAAHSLVAPAISSFAAADSEAGEAALWDIWNQVVGYALKMPVHQLDRVVEVLAAVADLKEPTEFKIWGEQVTWKQLSLLGPVIRECWDNEQHAESFNMNAFAARLTAADLVDLSIYAVWTLRSVLEDSAPGRIHSKNGDEGCKAAAAWFIYAGKSMYAFCKEGKTYAGRAAEQGSDIVGKDWNGYSEERWRLWVERLEEVQKAVVDDDTKKVLQKAMEAIHDATSE